MDARGKIQAGEMMSKILSGRFIMVVGFTTATCIGFMKGMIPADVFVPIVVLIVNAYFTRGDRENANNKPV